MVLKNIVIFLVVVVSISGLTSVGDKDCSGPSLYCEFDCRSAGYWSSICKTSARECICKIRTKRRYSRHCYAFRLNCDAVCQRYGSKFDGQLRGKCNRKTGDCNCIIKMSKFESKA